MVQQNQFSEKLGKDPNAHLSTFLNLAYIIKINGVPHDVIKIKLFLFSLREKAKAWYQSMPIGSIKTKTQFIKAFLAKFFPPPLTSELGNKILQFTTFKAIV